MNDPIRKKKVSTRINSKKCEIVSTKIHPKCPIEFTQKVSPRIHPNIVHECPLEFTQNVQENSPKMSRKIHLSKNSERHISKTHACLTMGPSPYYVSTFLDFFWPTHSTSALTVLKKLSLFLTAPTQSLCWRNIGMVRSLWQTSELTQLQILLKNILRYIHCNLVFSF